MFIQKLKIKNFKCFAENELNFCLPDGSTNGSGLNIFVGENNSGKSSAIEALYFLRNKIKRDPKRLGAKEGEEFFVECNFVGNIEGVIDDFAQDNKIKTFKEYIFNNSDNVPTLTVKKEFQTDDATKKICFWNQTEGYKPIGLDASFQKIFQISNIWARTNPEDESKFGSTTVCGNLLSDISEKFKLDHSDQYQQFITIFNQTFNDDKSGLQKDLNDVATETAQIMEEQFGAVGLKFKFDNPEPNILFKNIKVLVNDGEETELAEKGHGMQRAVILSLLQVYARRITEMENEDGEVKVKPHYLFIDEPEMGLHPQAQKKLFEALKVIAKKHQVFISTHSENFISADLAPNIFKFQKSESGVQINSLRNSKIDLKPYRKFFFHHHKLFFAKKAIFVEGADDYERMPIFATNHGIGSLKSDFYLLAGSGDAYMFRQLCDELAVSSAFFFDVDVLSVGNMSVKNFNAEIWQQILNLKKTCSKKDPSALQDVNLTVDEIGFKNAIVSALAKHSVFVLRDGAIEQYLTGEGKSLDDTKRDELIQILTIILNQ